MTNKLLYWFTLICAGLSLILFIAIASLVSGNQAYQAQLAQNQGKINTAATIMPISKQLSEALYAASVKNNDEKIRDLLVQQGFKLPEPQAKGAASVAKPEEKPVAAPAKGGK